MKLSDIKLTEKIRMMLTAPNGFGKTAAIASFWKRYRDRKQKMYFFDFDGRMNTVLLLYPEAEDTIEFDTYGPENFELFTVNWNKREGDNITGALVLDSFTSLTMAVVNFQMRLKGLSNRVTSKGMVVPGWDEINGETSMISQLLDDCKSISKDVFFTAHPVIRTEINTSGGTSSKVRSIAAYGNKIPSLAPIYFNEIYALDIENSIEVGGPPKRIAYTTPSGVDYAKTALPISGKLDITKGLYESLQIELKKKNIEF